jgi:hypothetical protein
MKNAIDLLDVSPIDCAECSDIQNFCNTFFESGRLGSRGGANQQNFAVIQQNIRSYKKNIDEFTVVLQSLDCHFTCIILTEAWLNDDSDLMEIPGYNLYRSYNNINQSDGVVVYIDSEISATCRELQLVGVATCLSVAFDWAGLPCELLAGYRSPNSNLNIFIDSIDSHFNEQRNNSKCIKIFAGDMNCNLLNVAPQTLEERYLDVLNEAGLVSCVDKVTRPASNTCIDHYFVKLPPSFDVASTVLQTSITDHYTVCMRLYTPVSNKTPNNDKYYMKIDWNGVKNSLSLQNWDHVINENEINLATNSFIQTLQNIILEMTTKIKISAKNTKIKPWITRGLINSIRHRDKLKKKLNRQPYNLALKNEFIRFRNMLHSTIKQAKYNYYKNKIDEVSNNPQKFWSVVKEVAGRARGPQSFPVGAFAQGGESTSTQNICDNFNKYFTSVGSSLSRSLNPIGEPEIRDYEFGAETVFEFKNVTEKEVMEVINSLKGKSAPGYDLIPTKIIKENSNSLIIPIRYIINLSIHQGLFPDKLKIAKIIPIYKSGPKNELTNYRPISLLATLSKIIEKCVKLQLTEYLSKNDILAMNQFGFQKSKNTNDALFEVTKYIVESVKLKNKVIMTFLDLAKAFDSVDRDKLLNKLEAIGVRNTALQWFKSYFCGRLQFVQIDGKGSEMDSVDYGVIQGSTLGPILFLVYINNVSHLNTTSKIFLFADDTVVISTGREWEEVYETATMDLSKIKNWFDHNSLTVNLSKTKYMPIVTRNQSDPGSRQVRMHSCRDVVSSVCDCGTIKRVDQYKYLGVIFDNRLSWVPHIQCLKQRLRRLLYGMSQLSQVLDIGLCRRIYHAYVQSILQYGIIVWGGVSSACLEPLAVTQRTIIKTILKKDSRCPTSLLFSVFPVLNVRQLFVKTLLIHIRKHKTELFVNIQHNIQTRHRNHHRYFTPRLLHGIELKSPLYLSQIIYRNLPDDIRGAEDCSDVVYKNRLVEWLIGVGWIGTERLLHSPYTF